MLKMAMKIKARAAESERKAAAAAAEVAAEAAAAAAALAEPREPPAPRKSADADETSRNPRSPAREAPPEKFLSDKERRKLEKKLLEQRRKEEKKKERERKKLEKMQKKTTTKKGSDGRDEARGPEAAAAAAAEGAAEGAGGGAEGAGVGGASRAWAEWDTDSGDEDDAYYAAPRVGGVVWRPGPLKAGALSAHLPLVVFLVFSVRSPSWVLNFLLQRRAERGRGCGFVFGATCCSRLFLGCAFFSYLGGRAKRRGRGRPGAAGAFGAGPGARRRGRDERLI